MAEILRTASYGDRTVKLYFSNHNERSEAELRLISYGFEVTQTPFSALRVSW